MPFPQSADSRDLSVVLCDSSCGQEQRWSCGEVIWQRQQVQLPALMQNLCDLISAGPSCAFSLSPELIAVSVHAWHANSAEINSTGRTQKVQSNIPINNVMYCIRKLSSQLLCYAHLCIPSLIANSSSFPKDQNPHRESFLRDGTCFMG